MARKLLMVAAVALVTLTSSISVGIAHAHWVHWSQHGWGRAGQGYNSWWPGYSGYYYAPYVAPGCYVTVYGTTACY